MVNLLDTFVYTITLHVQKVFQFWVQMAKPIFLKIGESMANFTSRM
jgi:hypothetical protein